MHVKKLYGYLKRMSKKAEQGKATRETLMSAARREFAAKGYTDTSVDGIACRANVTKGAFYHHFSGKEDLFLRVFENAKKELSRGAFATHADHPPFAPAASRRTRLQDFAAQSNSEVWQELLERCRRYVELHTDPAIRRIVLVDARWVLDREEWQRIESEYGVTLLRSALRRAMQRRIIKQLPLNVLALIVAGALNEACLLVAGESNGDDVLDQSMMVIEEMLNGLLIGELHPLE